MQRLLPHLETLPPSQRNLWPLLAPVATDFVLYGGTALSLQVGGRQSVYFDFFTSSPVNPEDLTKRFPFLRNAALIQRAEATASFSLNSPEPVKLSFFGTLDFGRVDEPRIFSDNGVVAAGPLDLAAQKVKVIQVRAEAKDYLDICSLIDHGVPLAHALGAAQTLYPTFNPVISLKALTFFDDGDLPSLPNARRNQLIAAASAVRDIPTIAKLGKSLLPARRPSEADQEIPAPQRPPDKGFEMGR